MKNSRVQESVYSPPHLYNLGECLTITVLCLISSDVDTQSEKNVLYEIERSESFESKAV